ncbi:hypothetical protein [Clostridium combesii]|uniref:Uncharacterized protein n=1 Tax=Clostridium combesii TaxID=39481 RepID=A0A2G7HCN5_9CLOT|nr:hypothetical protein [Clostridium combesii]PIH02829.1 hypothetical protein CS538_15490 [Clostridium combesii]
MIDTTLYIDKETEVNIQEDDDSFLLKLDKLFDYDLSIIGRREVFEKVCDVLESNLFDCPSYRELEEQLINKELLLEEAQNQLECLKDRIDFLKK